MALTTRLLGCGLSTALAAGLTAPAGAARFDGIAFNALVSSFRQHGFEVVSTHQRCLSERNLFGLYLRGTRRIVVCPRGNQLDTLMHEGWHAVQARCRKGAPLLSEAYLRANLSRADLRDIDALYSAKSWHREAEARAMAIQKMPVYLAHLQSSCGKPPLPGNLAQPPAAAPPLTRAGTSSGDSAPIGPAPAPAGPKVPAAAAIQRPLPGPVP